MNDLNQTDDTMYVWYYGGDQENPPFFRVDAVQPLGAHGCHRVECDEATRDMLAAINAAYSNALEMVGNMAIEQWERIRYDVQNDA